MCDKRDLQTVPIDNVGTLSKIYVISILFDFCWSSASLAVRLLHVNVCGSAVLTQAHDFNEK